MTMKNMKACTYLENGDEILSDTFIVKEDTLAYHVEFYYETEHIATIRLRTIKTIYGLELSGNDIEKYRQLEKFFKVKAEKRKV